MQRDCARPQGAYEHHGDKGKGDEAMGRVSTGELGSPGDWVWPWEVAPDRVTCE